jgi:hypothetical protein
MGSIKADREFLNPFSNQWLLKEYFELWIEWDIYVILSLMDKRSAQGHAGTPWLNGARTSLKSV